MRASGDASRVAGSHSIKPREASTVLARKRREDGTDSSVDCARSVNANLSRAETAVTIEQPPGRGTLRRVCASGEGTGGDDLRGVVAGARNLANPMAGCRAQQTCGAPNDPKGSAAEETVEAGRNGEDGRARCGNPSIARASARAHADAAARRTAEGRDGSRGERTNRRASPVEIEITPPVIAIPSGDRPRSSWSTAGAEFVASSGTVPEHRLEMSVDPWKVRDWKIRPYIRPWGPRAFTIS
jgi:hypothetical protein